MGNAFMRWLQEQQRKGRDAGQKAQQNNRQNKTRTQQQASGQQMMQNMRQNQQNKQQGEKNQRQNNQRQNGQRQNGQSRGQRQNQPQRQPQNYATAPTSPRAAAAQRQRFQHSTFANPEENRRRAQEHRTRGMPDYAYEVAGQQDKPNAADSVLGIPAFEIDENKLDRASNIPLINTFATWRKAYGSNPIEAADPLDYLQQITDRYLAPNDAEKAVQGMAQQAVETRAAKHTWGGIPGLSTIANDFDSGQAAKREQTMQEVLTLAQQTPTSGLYQNEDEKKNARSQMAASLSMTGQNTNTFPRGAVGKLTEQELDTLVYLERIGMNDWSKNNYVNLYAKHIADDVSKRQDEALAAYLESDDANPLGKAGARVLLGADNIMQNAVATPQYAYDVLEGSLNYVLTGDKSPVSENSFGSKGMRDANKAAELALHDTSEVGRFVGQGVMSGVNSAANMVMFGPKGGAIAMGVQAGAGSAYDTAQKGGDVTQQLSTGIASGAAESLMEYVSFGVLDDIIKSPVGKKTILEFMKKMGAQVGTEAATEALTELSNIGSELVLLGEKSDLASVYNEYLNRNNAQANAMEAFHGKEITDEQRAAVKRLREKGTDKNGALLAALQYTLQRSGYAAAQGAFMGGIMGGGGTALNFARTPSKAKVAFDKSVRAQTMQALNNPIASSQHPATGVNAYAQKQQELAAEVERVQVQRQEQAALQQQTQQAQQWAQNQPPEVQSAMQQALDEGAPPDIAMGLAARNAEQRAAVQASTPTIENAGQRGYTTSNPATAFTDTNGGANNGRDILLYGGSQWQAGAHSREPGGRMAGIAGAIENQYLDGRGQAPDGSHETSHDGRLLQNQGRINENQNGATYPSAEEAALSFARNAVEVDTFAGRVQAIPEGVYTPEMHQLKEGYAQRGVDVEYIASPIVTKTGFRAAGAYENGVMLVYASSERGIENVAAHEYFHHKFGKEQTDAAIDVLKKNMPTEKYKAMVERYIEMYFKEYDGDMGRIYEEIAADHYAENETVRQLVDGNAENTTHATGEASKKDVRYSGSRDKGKQPKPPNIFSHLTPEVVQRINADLEASRAQEAGIGTQMDAPTIEKPTAINTVADEHSRVSQQEIDKYVNAVDPGMVEFVRRVKGGERGTSHTVSPVNTREVADIQRLTGINTTGFSHVLGANQLADHIQKRHGQGGKADSSMRYDEDLARMGYVLENYDNVDYVHNKDGGVKTNVKYPDKNGKPSPILLYEKAVDGTYYISEVAVDSKKRSMVVTSAYMGNKKGSSQPASPNQRRRLTSETAGSFPSTPNIPPESDVVKRKGAETKDASETEKAKQEAMKAQRQKILDGLPAKAQKTKKQLADDAVDFFNRKWVDSAATIERMANAVGDKTLYPVFNNARQAQQKAEYMIGLSTFGKTAQFDFTGNKVGESLADIWAPVAKKGQAYTKNFELYLLNRHNIDRMAQGKPVFGKEMTAPISKELATDLEAIHPEFAQLAEKVWKYSDNLITYRVQAGLLSDEQANTLRNVYPHYVPTYRDNSSTAGIKARGNKAEVAQTVKTAIGSDKPIIPVQEALAQQTIQVVSAAAKNEVATRMSQYVGDKKARQYVREVEKTGLNYDVDDATDTIFAERMDTLPNQVVFYDNGEKRVMTVSPQIFEGFQAIGGGDLRIKALEAGNTVFKQLITGYNPLFIMRNFARDLQDAGFFTKDLAGFAKAYPKAFAEMAKGGGIFQLYQAMGGFQSSFFDYDKGLKSTRNALQKHTVDRIETVNMLIEQLPRFAEFHATVESGGKGYDNLVQAMYNAADITVNFGRSGTWGRFLNRTFVPFFNPSIQGFDKYVRNFRQTKGAKKWLGLTFKAALLGVAPSLLNHLLLQDDEEYKMLDERTKNNYYLFPVGDGKFFKIPKGRAVSTFGNLARNLYETTQGRGEWKEYLTNLQDQMAPVNPFESNFFSPLLNAANNKTWYGGQIENAAMKNLRAGDRYNEKTDELSKWIGKNLNISPARINYVLDAYSGVVGDFALPLLTKKAEQNPFTSAFVTDSVYSNRISQDFYGAKDEINYRRNEEPKSGVPSANDLLNRYLNKQSDACSDLYKEIRNIEASDKTDEEKRTEARILRAEINAIQQAALLALPELEAALAKSYVVDAGADEKEQKKQAEAAYEEALAQVFGNEKEMAAGYDAPAPDTQTVIKEARGYTLPSYKQPTLDLIAAFGVSTEDWAYVEDRLPAAENKVEQILDWGFTGLPLQGLVEHQVMGETAQAKLLTATEMGIDKETYIDGYVFGYTSKGTKAQRNQQIYEYVDELPGLTPDQRAQLYEWLKVSRGSGEYSGSSGGSSGGSGGRRRGRRSSKKASTRKKKASKTEEEAEYEKGLAFVKFARAAAKKQPQVKGDQNLSFGEELLKKKAAIKQAAPDSFPEQNSVFYKAILENAKKKGGKR